MTAFKTELCEAFLAHWQSLRRGDALPTLKDYLGRPHAQLQPNTVIKDIIAPRRIHVRLHGTRLVELSGVDLTGQNLLDYASSPEFADHYWTLHEEAIAHQCGVSGIKNTIAVSGRAVVFEDIALPVTPFPGGPPCMIGCVSLVEGLDYKDTVFKLVEYASTRWIDIGWGVPAGRMPKRVSA